MKKGILTICFIAVVTLLIYSAWKGLDMRKEITSQEIIPKNRKIAVINGYGYLNDRLQVTLYGDEMSRNMTYDDLGMCIFDDLENNKEYKIEVRRTDLKGALLYKKKTDPTFPREAGAKYIVLVGASVGKNWKFTAIPERLHLGEGIVFGYRCKYDFDKSKEIDILTKLPNLVSVVIIKECAAYFPRELNSSKRMIVEWVNKLHSRNIIPLLATVIPVTYDHDTKNPGKFDSLLNYNDFIREYCEKESIQILDLEKATRNNENDRHLKEEYAEPDGLHLNKRAYDEALDKIAAEIIENLLK